jgi:Gas vesicle synthesis protein GvpL/GvpF
MTTSPTTAPPTAATYVYGVMAAGSIPAIDLDGVAGARVRSIADGGLAAIVSALPSDDLRIRRRDLLNHLRVLEYAFADATVVPCAFGMVLPSEEAVRHEFLEPRREELLGLLERLDGYGQLNVRVTYDEDVVLQEVVEADPTIAQLREQTRKVSDEAGYGLRMQLGELVASALASARERDGQAILERLAKHAEDVAPDEPGQDVLKASFLVADKKSEDFDRELERIADEQAPRLLLEVVGPLPPAAFATLEREAWGS